MALIHDGRNICISGYPGVGKTTLMVKLADALRHYDLAGFYTVEIRERGVRKGFELVGFNGGRRILSHIDIQSPHRVGKYGVDVSGFERFLDELKLQDSISGLILIDEIGKMECLSRKFTDLIVGLLESSTPVIATIASKGGGFIDRVKRRKDVEIIEITTANRDLALRDIVKLF